MSTPNWKTRYAAAYESFQHKAYPASSRDFGTLPPKYPDVRTANGLTNFILNFIKWSGYRATRVNVSGRLIEKATRTESGASFMDKKWITSSTRKGSADVSSTINGRSAMFEVKVGKDKPSEHQLKEQALERAAGGVYEFVCTPEEFLAVYDKLLS